MMKSHINTPVLIVALSATLLLAGCVRSLHPIYTSSDVVFNKALIGTWRQAGEESTWQFTESEDDDRDRAYRLVFTDDKGRSGTFLAHLVKLDDELFLDLFPIAPQAANNGFYKFHFQRVHTFLRVELGEQKSLPSAVIPIPQAGSLRHEEIRTKDMNAAMFTDLYELTMAQAYVREGMQQPAVFELFFRKLPDCRNFVVAAGLENVLEMLEGLRFTTDHLDYLREQGQFGADFLNYLKDFRFTGDVYALAEGTVVFPHEPLVQVVAPLPMAQVIETLVLNQVHFASLVAAKAARIVLAAGKRKVVDFGSRRAHGIDAALTMARATYLVGAAGTSLVLAGQRYGIPIFGTMAHSYIQAHDNELESFRAFARQYPDTTLLVDTYDTLDGVRKVIELHRQLGDDFRVKTIRLDSGDLDQLARDSRRRLDRAGLQDVTIFASGGLDEYKLHGFDEAAAPIDGYGIGTALAVSDDAPSLDMAYKLVEYDGRPRTKLSSSKVIYPGPKQVYRQLTAGQMTKDLVALHDHDEPSDGEPLLQPVMERGRRMPAGRWSLEQSREHAREQLRKLPPALRALATAESPYSVEISKGVQESLDRFRRSHAAGEESDGP